MSDPSREDRIVAARLALRDRFLARPKRPGRAGGTGEPNRHGEFKLPPGQARTEKWPVLDLGTHPKIETDAFSLTIDGAVHDPISLSFTDLLALPQVEEASDFHCVTGWSQMDLLFVGVPLVELLALASPTAAASHLLCHASDGYTTSLSLADATAPDVLVVHRAQGAPLDRAHGGPVRMIPPRLYAWKGAKWLSRLELRSEATVGFWERQGYAAVGDPWTEDRYADPDHPPAGAET